MQNKFALAVDTTYRALLVQQRNHAFARWEVSNNMDLSAWAEYEDARRELREVDSQ